MEQTKRRFGGLRWPAVIIAVLLAVLLAVETPLSAYAASEKGIYIKEVIMITASSTDDARQKTKKSSDDAGKTYTLFETPIYECDGLQTYVAYTTTNNKANAVKSIKAMNMKGGWSYEEYDKYLDQLKDKANFLAKDLYEAILEYAKCLAANKPNALYAKKILDYLYEDDSKKTVSDFFVALAAKGSYDAVKDVLITFTMESNMNILSTVESALMIACADAYAGEDKNDINFMTGMQQPTYLKGLNGFVNNPNYAMYDVYVQDILISLPDVQEDIRFYMNSGFMIEDEVEEMAAMQEATIVGEISNDSENPLEDYLEQKEIIREAASAEANDYELSEEEQAAARRLEECERYIDSLSKEDKNHYTNGKIYYSALKNSAYTGYVKNGKNQYENLLGLIMAHDNMEDYTNEDFYPLIQKLTKGQRALLKVGFSQLLSSVLVPTSVMDITFYGMLDTVNEKAETEDEKIKKGDVVSVYEGIDRSLFQKNSGIALTSQAIKKAQEKPFAHVATSAEKIQNICDIIAIASGGMAATSLVVGAGFATYAYLSFQAQFAQVVGVDILETSTTNFLNLTLERAGEFFGNYIVTESTYTYGAGWTVEQTLNGIAVSATNMPATFSNCVLAFLRAGLGAVLKWVSVVSIGVMIISLVVKYLAPLIAKEGDEPYVNIPRVMCSYQPIYGQEYEDDPEEDYIYYYGVKNPLLTDDDQQRALVTKDNESSEDLDVTKFMIGDVCNWTLKGLSRQWVALYTSTDSKSGKPILADSLKVLTSAADFNKDTSLISVKVFNNSTPLNFHNAYDITANVDSTPRYLGYKVDNTESSQSASVFSSITVWGGLIAALVIGGGVGSLVTYTVIRKRKKKAAQA